MSEELKQTIEEIAGHLTALRNPSLKDTGRLAVFPDNVNVHDLEQYMAAPLAIRDNKTFVDVSSFVAYFNKFKAGATPILLAQRTFEALVVTCVFDYHDNKDGEASPKWGKHIAKLELKYDPDFKRWRENSGTLMGQLEFAEWVEEFTPNFVQPDGATMLEIAQELKGTRNVAWGGGTRLNNGQQRLEYVEDVAAQSKRGDVTVPDKFVVSLQVFAHLAPQAIEAAFRWRLGDDKKLKMGYRFLQLRAAIEEAMDLVEAEVKSGTGMDLLYTA